ncbi:helix-turn-helix transcriptional regulator [candidate division KSB1 bacterium]|nr:helix-turn-helix transcriptional regulator [candidate division KSB1 bacterium]
MQNNKSDIDAIQKLVGPIPEEHLAHTDFYCSTTIGLILPATDSCKYCQAVMHKHPAYSFLLHFDDYYILEINGQKLHIAHGDLTAISPNILHVHHEQSSERITRYAGVFIPEDYFIEQISLYPNLEPVRLAGDIFRYTPELSANVKEFILEAEGKMPGYMPLLDAIGLRITHAIIRIIYDVSIPTQKTNLRLNVDQAIQFMHGHYPEKIDTKQLARQAHLSPSHFSRIFKHETGKSPIEYLIGIRLHKARKLLHINDSSITEIALSCGFSSTSHFSSFFQKSFGVTPLKYRQSLK